MPNISIMNNLDLNHNQLLNFLVQNLATDPGSVPASKLYYNTTSNRLKYFNGTIWIYADGQDAVAAGAILLETVTTLNDFIIGTGNATVTRKTPTEVKTILGLDAIVANSHIQNTDTGTTSGFFGISGIKLKNSSDTELQLRNSTDSAYIDLKVKNLTVEGTTTIINSNDVNIGDNELILNADIATSGENSDGGLVIKRLMDDNVTRKDAKIIFNNSTGKFATTMGAVTGALVTAQLANKVVAVIGDGVATSIVIPHNLNSRALCVSVCESNTPWNDVMVNITKTTLDTITVSFKWSIHCYYYWINEVEIK